MTKKWCCPALLNRYHGKYGSWSSVSDITNNIILLNSGCEHIDHLLHTIEKQRTIDKLGGGRHSFFSSGASPDSIPQTFNRIDPTHSMVEDVILEPVIRKLKNLGMNEQVEDQLLSVQSLLKKLGASKRGFVFEHHVCKGYCL